jgi:hypothetical protein
VSQDRPTRRSHPADEEFNAGIVDLLLESVGILSKLSPQALGRWIAYYGGRCSRKEHYLSEGDIREMCLPKAKVILLASLGFLGGMIERATADEWDQKTVFTFASPVEIPGQVLEPGTYVFKLLDSQSDRNIVQVFNQREDHLYGTFLAIPDYRLKPAGKPIITFEERAAGAPEAVKAWFYPGQNYGHDFVYPKVKAVELAKANQQPVASMPTDLADNTTKPAASVQEPQVAALQQAPLKAQQPTEEVEIAEVFSPIPPTTLPQTASSLPLVGLIGLLSLGGAGLLRLAGARSH